MTSDRTFCFTPEVYQPKITHRPLKTNSQVTRDTIEETFRKDQLELDRRLAKYRVNANKQHHSSRPLERGNTIWDDGKIVDRGRGRPQSSHFPTSSEDHLIRRKKFVPVPGSMKDQDPISDPWTETWSKLNDPIISRTSSRVAYSKSTPLRNGHQQYGVFDPINCKWVVEPDNEERRNKAGYVNLHGRAHFASECPTLYHPYVHEQVGRVESPRRGKMKTNMPRDQGVYDPIKNRWLVLPENQRIYEGRSFAPVSKHVFR